MFYLSARMFGEACLELFIYRFAPNKKMQLYLLPRPKNDPFYAGMMHLPGARKIPTETGQQTLARAFRETPFNPKNYVIEHAMNETYKAKRGVEYADIRRVFIHEYNPAIKDFYYLDDLPDNIIAHHKQIIKDVTGVKHV